jgi:hypothetical protein
MDRQVRFILFFILSPFLFRRFIKTQQPGEPEGEKPKAGG